MSTTIIILAGDFLLLLVLLFLVIALSSKNGKPRRIIRRSVKSDIGKIKEHINGSLD